MRRSKPELWVMYLETFSSSLGKCPYCVLHLRSILKLPLASLSFLSCLRSVPIQFILHSTLKIQPVLNPQPTLSLTASTLASWIPPLPFTVDNHATARASVLPTLPNLPMAPTSFTARAKPSSIL